MNIVIPTHQKDFHWNIDFLKSFNEKCLDKNESTITFVLSDGHEESIFRKTIADNLLDNLNLKITNLDYLVKTLGMKKDGLNGIKLPRNLHFDGKYSIISLKKIYGVLHSNEDSIVLDSENICVNEFYIKDVFNSIKSKPLTYSLLDDPYDYYEPLSRTVAEESADILKTTAKMWFFQKTYWFYEIEKLKMMIDYIKEIHKTEEIISILCNKNFFDYQLYGHYLFVKNLKEFSLSYEPIKSKSKLFESWKKSLLGKRPIQFSYICRVIDDYCIDEYIHYLNDENERIVKLHWMSDEHQNRIKKECKIAIGTLHQV